MKLFASTVNKCIQGCKMSSLYAFFVSMFICQKLLFNLLYFCCKFGLVNKIGILMLKYLLSETIVYFQMDMQKVSKELRIFSFL